MNLGGFALLLAAVFAGGSGAHTAAVTGAHTGVAHTSVAHTVATDSTTSNSQPSADPSPTLSLSGTTGTLTQAGPGTWQVTVLMDDPSPNCAGVSGKTATVGYRLRFTIPGGASSTPIAGHATPAPVPLQPPPPTGSSCEIAIKFTGLNQVPISATLDLDQGGASSAITLTVSRTVTLYSYLAIPAVVGGIMVLIMLLAALRYVRLYTVDGRPVRWWRDPAYWKRPLAAAGAWSLNDSWATNITTVVTLLATILGTTTAASALFPGVALDRFVIVNIVAGGIVAVAPLAFGVFYAGWTRHNPGILADASLALPQATAVTLASPAKLALARNTPVVLAAGGRRTLRATAVATVARTAVIQLRPDSSTATFKAGTKAAVPAGARAALEDRTTLRLSRWWILRPGQRRPFPAATEICLPAGASVRLERATMQLPGDGSAVLAEDATAELGAATAARIEDGPAGTVGRATTIRLRAGTEVTPLPRTLVTLTSTDPATLPSGTKARIPRRAVERHGLPPWPARVTLAADASATLESGAAALLADVSKVPAAIVDVPSGADIVLPGGGTVTASGHQQGPVTVKKGRTVHVPPQTRISILAGAVMTIPGTSDITVNTASTLVVERVGAAGGSLAIPSDDVDPGHAAAADAMIGYPARIEAVMGAKVTVAGVADVTLPAGTTSRASYRAEAELGTERSLQVPAGGNVLFGNLRMILGAAVLTMFGIGAEIGIAGVLAYGLSEASLPWRWAMLAVTGLVGLLTIAYSVTAIRAIADPRPGSSISATSGTSFTL
jgi:hypothetical protein